MKITDRYLVVVAGSPRGGEKTWNSLYKNVLDHLNADLAVVTSKDFVDENLSLFKKAKYIWIFEEFKNYFEYYSKNYSQNAINYLKKGKGTGLYESGSIHFVFKDFVLNNYLPILNKYDFIIYTRFDQFYITKHREGNKEKILIPRGEDYSGLCDRHAIIPREYIKKYLEICDYIDSNKYEKYPTDYLNCETTYLNQLRNNNLINLVERIERYQFTSSLRQDKTNWRVAIYKLYGFHNLYIKYPDEFMESMKNIFLFHKLKIFTINISLTLNYLYLKIRRILGRLKNYINLQKHHQDKK